jgi:DNA-directed RNA polymerase subunit E"
MSRACRNCGQITEENICPNCKSTEIGDDWSGLFIVMNPDESKLAEKLEIKKAGRYALKVR